MMNLKKKVLITVVCVFVIMAAVLYLNVIVMQKVITACTYTEIEHRGYAAEDIMDIKIDHSYFRRLLGYNEWRIAVEFEKEPDVFFWFSYKNKMILFEGVSSDPMMDKDSVIAYSEKIKQGTLLSE